MIGRPPSTAPEAAVAEVRAMGLEPEEPYPGSVGRRWKLRCTVCGRSHRYQLSGLRVGRRCAHTRGYLTNEEAEQELHDGGFEPLEPYPGRVSRSWRARCLTCGAVRHPSLNRIRQGKICKHRPV